MQWLDMRSCSKSIQPAKSAMTTTAGQVIPSMLATTLVGPARKRHHQREKVRTCQAFATVESKRGRARVACSAGTPSSAALQLAEEK